MGRRQVKLSKPGEHGGLVTLTGNTVLALVVTPEPLAALAAGVVYLVAYLARGPIERKARHFRLHSWDLPALGLYAACAALAGLHIASSNPTAALVVMASALLIPAVGALVTTARIHRWFAVELAAMGSIGGTAGMAMYAGGATIPMSALIGLAMASYAAAAVPTVRAEVRDLAPTARARQSWLGVFVLGLGAALTAVFLPAVSLAFAPRIAHGAWRAIRGIGKHRITCIAARETAEVALFMALLVTVITTGPWP
ncbi:MAG: YwiC-like family protein [Proteobacteria bacterium]|nr:YwiC-like family protein [Pseudomonadota bacterium]